MKLKPSALRIFIYFLITSLILLLVLISMCFTIFFFQPWDYKQWVILGFWLALSIVFLILLLKNYYYKVEDKYFSLTKFNKETCYGYSDIFYIDIEYSSKHSSILIITSKGEAKYFVKDKENKLLDILIKNCKNVLDKETLLRTFPHLIKDIS